MRSWRDAALAACVVAAAYAAFTFALLRHYRNDVSRFVVAGSATADPARVPPGLTVVPNIAGYDGQIFYRLALDPFSHETSAYGITLVDLPYRQQRILYPAIVWLLSWGHPALVPALLLLVNEAAIIAIAILGCFITRSSWGALLAMYPGFLHTLAHDTSEIVAAAFVTAGIAALLREKSWTSALLLSAAVLTRETTILVACAAAAAWLWSIARRSRPSFSPAVFLLPIASFAAWQTWIAHYWGVAPFLLKKSAVSIPFRNYAAFLIAHTPPRFHLERIQLEEALYLGVFIVCAVVVWRRSTMPLFLRIACVAYLALFATLPSDVWLEDVGFMRVLGDFAVVLAIPILTTRATSRWVFAAMTIPLWGYLAAHIVRYG